MATEAFYSGQPDYIEKLNFLYGVAEAAQGPDGWTPNLVVSEDGPRLVIEVVSWSSGTGPSPDLGYLSDTGVVPNIEDATNIRGDTGLTGNVGPSNVLDIGTVTEGATAEATITGTSPSQLLNLVLPKGNTGDDGREVEFNKSATHLQWRYVGDVTWIDLVLLSEITGPAGNDGTNGTNGTDGTDGTNGVDGADGRGIVSITQTAGDSSPGSTDTYTITYTDATTSTFDVYNGADGTSGASDWAAITGKPTTLSGYGITDAVGTGDSRLTDSRTPTGTAGGVLSGTYPNPGFAADMATQAELDAVAAAKQDTLVSGTNIKTINGVALPGSGDITIGGGLIPLVTRTSNTQLVLADLGKMIDITSGAFTQTFAAAATLGAGWWCYLKNSTVQSNITLDPNSTEQIDGLTTYIMYPGECRLVLCTGTAFTTTVINSFFKVFEGSDTFVRPPGYRYFEGLAWGGGGAGDSTSGGGGGACTPFKVPTAWFSASETVTVGTGGIDNGIHGGNTVIHGTSPQIIAFGGQSANGANAGGGGGVQGAGSGLVGGAPSASSTAGASNAGFGGGNGGNGTTRPGGYSVYGGGGGGNGTTSGGKGGDSVYGGGGGGQIRGSSQFGGRGGQSGAGQGEGAAPGGGGGPASSGSRVGARGELRIWGII